MKKLIGAALLLGGILMTSPSVFAQNFKPDYLYFGFQNQAGSGTEDYIINLGAGSNIVGGTVVVDLSADFSRSSFNAVLGASSSMFGGVVGGLPNASGTADEYVTQFRSGGAGIPSVPGSTVTATASRAVINNAISTLNQLILPATTGQSILDTSKSWESFVEPANSASTFLGASGFNPDSPVGPSTILYEDLWYTSNNKISGANPYIYEGYFTLDLTGSNPKLTFTPKNAAAQLQPPVILSVSNIGGTATVVWSTLASYTYQLQYTTSLSPTNWINVGSALVAGGTTMTNTSAGTDPQRYYRVSAH